MDFKVSAYLGTVMFKSYCDFQLLEISNCLKSQFANGSLKMSVLVADPIPESANIKSHTKLKKASSLLFCKHVVKANDDSCRSLLLFTYDHLRQRGVFYFRGAIS